jgi:hypothetical protein
MLGEEGFIDKFKERLTCKEKIKDSKGKTTCKSGTVLPLHVTLFTPSNGTSKFSFPSISQKKTPGKDSSPGFFVCLTTLPDQPAWYRTCC